MTLVKSLDDERYPELLDHVGWRLWRAAQLWKADFDAKMVAMGYAWFGEARAAVIAHLDRGGTRQALLAKRLGLSKQAVQQFVDELERDGIVERRPDPDDSRAKIVTFTARGRKALADANIAKRQIEAEFRRKLGRARLEQLIATLRAIDDGA
jgi:DNA-binding MarR family transcriptional regulator